MNTTNLITSLAEFKQQLLASTDQEDRLELLIDWGKKLPPLDPQYKTSNNRLSFCASETYVHIAHNAGKLEIAASSAALITSGYLYILTTALNGIDLQSLNSQTDEAIQEFADATGINISEIPSRMNAFSNFYLAIKTQAQTVRG